LTIEPRALATILAALRYFQDEFQAMDAEELAELFPQFAKERPLTPAEIDALCERLNTPESEPG